MKQEFEKAYDDYADAIFRHCYMRVHDRDRAKELMQEAFLKTWEYLSQGKKIDNIRAFLYRVSHNLILNEWRKKQVASLDTMNEDEGFDPEGDTGEAMTDRLDAEAMVEKLKELDAKQREAIVMRYIDGLPVKEIAGIIGESENVVSVRIHRALKQLKKILKNYE